jgi:hypothetical protein
MIYTTPDEAYDAASEAELMCGSDGACSRDDCNGFVCRNAIDAAIKAALRRDSIARGPGIVSPLDEATAEVERLQSVIDSRPAINAALPDSYIKWSQAIYVMELSRAQGMPS